MLEGNHSVSRGKVSVNGWYLFPDNQVMNGVILPKLQNSLPNS
jgi:hypothetical protein